MTLHEFSLDYAPSIQALTTVLGLCSLMLLWYQIRKTNSWNRVSAAFQIMELDKFYKLEEQASLDCKAINVPFPSKLSAEHAHAIRNNYNAYHAVKHLMIFLDRIAVAYQAGYIDKDVIVFTYGPLLSGYHEYLESYIDYARKELDAPETYRDLKRTANEVRARLDSCRTKLRAKERLADERGGIRSRY